MKPLELCAVVGRKMVLLVLAFGLVVACTQIGYAQSKHLAGVWKLNLEKSKYTSGNPPMSETREYEDRGGGVWVGTFRGVNAQGKATFTRFTAKPDGKLYPIATPGSSAVLLDKFMRIDAYTMEFTSTSDGKITLTGKISVSKDGKTLTATQKFPNRDGENIRVYDRQ